MHRRKHTGPAERFLKWFPGQKSLGALCPPPRLLRHWSTSHVLAKFGHSSVDDWFLSNGGVCFVSYLNWHDQSLVAQGRSMVVALAGKICVHARTKTWLKHWWALHKGRLWCQVHSQKGINVFFITYCIHRIIVLPQLSVHIMIPSSIVIHLNSN